MRFTVRTIFSRGESIEVILRRLFRLASFCFLLHLFLHFMFSPGYFLVYWWVGPPFYSGEGRIEFFERKLQYEWIVLHPTWFFLCVPVLLEKVGLLYV